MRDGEGEREGEETERERECGEKQRGEKWETERGRDF